MKHYVHAATIIGLAVIFVGFIAKISDAANTGILVPIANGNYQQWSPSDPRYTHFSQVDEFPCNGNTDFVYVRNVGFRESYRVNLSSISNGEIISSITITPCAGYMALGASTTLPVMNLFYRWNGVNSSDAGNYTINTITPTTLTPTQFNGLSLTKDSTSNLEIGAVYTRPSILSGIAGIRLSNINVVLSYASSTASSTPFAPSNLTATSTGTSTPIIRLNWQDNSTNETNFVIKRGTNPSSLSYYTSVPANVTTFDDYVSHGATYYYCVLARNINGDSACSNIVSGTGW